MNTMKIEKLITYIFVGILLTTFTGILCNCQYGASLKKLSKKNKRLENYDLSIQKIGKVETINNNSEVIDFKKLYPLEKADATEKKS